MKKGIEFVPARLKQKRPRHIGDEVMEKGSSVKKHGSGMWEPTSSADDHSDSDDSMSDLYPCKCPRLAHWEHSCMVIQCDLTWW